MSGSPVSGMNGKNYEEKHVPWVYGDCSLVWFLVKKDKGKRDCTTIPCREVSKSSLMDILDAQQWILQHGNAPADTVLRVCSLRFVRFLLTTEQHTEHCWQKAWPLIQQAPLYKKSNFTDLRLTGNGNTPTQWPSFGSHGQVYDVGKHGATTFVQDAHRLSSRCKVELVEGPRKGPLKYRPYGWWKKSCTSWYGKYLIFVQGFIHPRWCRTFSINSRSSKFLHV